MEKFNDIDINCDLGEGIENEEQIMPYIHSCNIACGGHYGNEATIKTTLLLAKKYKVAVGAHPSFPDKENFGRKTLSITPKKLEESIVQQINSFLKIAKELGLKMAHIKLHGALYNLAAREIKTAKIVINAFRRIDAEFSVFTPPNSQLATLAKPYFKIIHEAFIDRTYQADLSLTPRTNPNACIESNKAACEQFKKLYFDKEVLTVTGEKRKLHASTFCIHSDSPFALEQLQFIYNTFSLNPIEIIPFGENAISINWPQEINTNTQQQIQRCISHLRNHGKAFIQDIVPAYCSLVIYLKQTSLNTSHLHKLKNILSFPIPHSEKTPNTWEIPVCYDTPFSEDLTSLSEHHLLRKSDVIEKHTAPRYTIFFTGFLPGFLYLGGLDPQLHTPRKQTPKPKTPKGSVAIGGNQTGIYPLDSPGGWHIIGRTPIPLFKTEGEVPTPFKNGDHIVFKSITINEFENLEKSVNDQTFNYAQLITND